jgi:uncharacterized protein YuzE
MATKPVKATESKVIPKAVVSYDEKADLLYISAGSLAPFGDTIANGVVMFYDRDPDEAGASAVAMHVLAAEAVLKPFVDAMLRKYGATNVPTHD